MKRLVLASMLVLSCSTVSAAPNTVEVKRFTPQGYTPDLGTVTVEFSRSVTAFGDSQQVAPYLIHCDDPELRGEGRWLDDKRWTYAFNQQVPAGVSCSAKLNSSFIVDTNLALAAGDFYKFSSSGPELQSQRPYYEDVSEEQAFVLRFATPVASEQLASLASCHVEGIGEAIPVQVLSGQARIDVLSAALYNYEPKLDSTADQVLKCARRLAPGAKLTIHVAAGLASYIEGREPISIASPINLEYKVREPFSAKLLCTRTKAQAPCHPLLPIRLSFTADVSADKLALIRLRSGSKEWTPELNADETYITGESFVSFKAPFPANEQLQLVLPKDFSDEDGRSLNNLESLQAIRLATAEYPPLLKFASGDFGLIERFAHLPDSDSTGVEPPTVPLSVRAVEASLAIDELQISAAEVLDYATQDDAQVLAWIHRLRRLDETSLTKTQLQAVLQGRELSYNDTSEQLDTRSLSVFKQLNLNPEVLHLPEIPNQRERSFEVIGIPLPEPGFHVLEAKSSLLGAAMLEDQQDMYVRTSVLVTNLSVHMKKGRDDFLVWVTSLDDAKVVANAFVRVLDCTGTELLSGMTNTQGVLHVQKALEQPYCDATGSSAFYVSARIPADHPQARGKADFSFVLSDWDRGIESWRFNVPVGYDTQQDGLAHTVLDRNLFRAGEVVSMKHILRNQSRDGLVNPQLEQLSKTLRITHDGTGESIEQPLVWELGKTEGAAAYSSFTLPKEAALGEYSVMLTGDSNWYPTASFRVEEFKLPLLKGTIKITDQALSSALVRPEALTLDMQLHYLSGGAAGSLPVSLSAVAKTYSPSFANYDDYSFVDTTNKTGDYQSPAAEQQLFLDKLPVVLDANGGARLNLATPPTVSKPEQWLFEASFSDPNGQVQTLSQSTLVWPSKNIVGISTPSWANNNEAVRLKAVVLNSRGEVQANQKVWLRAEQIKHMTVRKRMVGGFYRYDNQQEHHDLGELCHGTTDAKGEFECEVKLEQVGSIIVFAESADNDDRKSSAAQNLWLSGREELWFGGENDDRIDLIPERKVYAPGEIAEFQVRMPFAEATALLSVEREGVLDYQTISLSSRDPMVRLAIKEEWGPNVYVSVLAIRGRLREVRWQSFFGWGWKQPVNWYKEWSSGAKVAPSSTIDLAKPSYRLGLAAIEVRSDENQLNVALDTDQKQYAVRDQAKVKVSVRLPDGSPASGGRLSFAVVDEALLELSPNPSWDVLSAMLAPHSYGVQTATAQSEVVGRRHYGRKAVSAGGGGGKAPTRELLDTLVLWVPKLQLDEQGQAELIVPLKDSLSSFRLVAMAEYGTQRFGKGESVISTTQDVELISGLPMVIREGDKYNPQVTIRNSSERDMELRVAAAYAIDGGKPRTLSTKTIKINAAKAERLSWQMVAPAVLDAKNERVLTWTITAEELSLTSPTQRAAKDSLTVQQRLLTVTPVQAQQATLVSISSDQPYKIELAAPAQASKKADDEPLAHLSVLLRSRLVGDLPEVRQWFENYPYTCYEQQLSKAVGLEDQRKWSELMGSLDAYLDGNGLVRYFPSATLSGSEVLTAYVLILADEMAKRDSHFVIPDLVKKRMLAALYQVAIGRLKPDLRFIGEDKSSLQLMVLDALARYQMIQATLLDSIEFSPERWSVESLIDWLSVSEQLPSTTSLQAQRRRVLDLLRASLVERGTSLSVSNVQSQGWLMRSDVTAQARLLLWAQTQKDWADEVPRLLTALIAQQQKGRWRTTTENALATLALSQQRASGANKGHSIVEFDGQTVQSTNWAEISAKQGIKALELSLPLSEKPKALTIDYSEKEPIWALLRSFAAVPLNKSVSAGYAIQRELTPVSQVSQGVWTVGDIYRVRLTLETQAAMTWTVINDPIPAGATVLGSGLGRDSVIATAGEDERANTPSYVERAADAYRAYFDYLPRGTHHVEYTVRLNSAGDFNLPETRVEALYEPDAYAMQPNVGLSVVEP